MRADGTLTALEDCSLHGTGSNPADPAGCPRCEDAQMTLDAIEAAAALEGRYRDHGGALHAALEQSLDYHKRHVAPPLHLLERWAILLRKVGGY